MRKDWRLDQEAFNKLLDWFDPNRDKAGLRYEIIRSKLITIFLRRGCRNEEDLADETINRVIAKIDQLSQSYVGDPAWYFYGVAKNIIHESLNPPMHVPITPSPDPPEEKEKAEACLNQCLKTLPAESTALFRQYFLAEQSEKTSFRKELADQLEIPLNTLRMRIHRIRGALQKCIRDCIQDS